MNNDARSLTDQQTKLLAFLRAFIKQHGWSPSIREAMPSIEAKSTSTVSYQLRKLEDKGLIRRGNGPRTLTVVDAPHTEEHSEHHNRDTDIRPAGPGDDRTAPHGAPGL